MARLPPRIDVLGSKISVCDGQAALNVLEECIGGKVGGFVCFTNVHAAVMGYQDPEFRRITNSSLLSVADGKPVYWAARAAGNSDIGHVAGPDFMLSALSQFPQAGHFFYGSTSQVLQSLVVSLQERIPALNVCGTFSPPFRPLDVEERADVVRMIRTSGAKFIWVGLGAPKQEKWMAEISDDLKPAILFGVGAAFDFHAGVLQRAPLWLRRRGLEWLYRLIQEPKRLWKRYLVTNTLFVYYLIRRKISAV